jgi:hypothetical protein
MTIARFFLLFVFLTVAAGAEVYEPKPGTPARKAIMEAMRVPVAKAVGAEVIFTGNVHISGDWAKFTGDVATKDGKPPKRMESEMELDFFALLRRENGEWKVLFWAFAGDISAYEDAKKKYPNAPKDLMPD